MVALGEPAADDKLAMSAKLDVMEFLNDLRD
jgi:hypothetical protein